MKTLVITGGIGSGKSLVARYIASKGIPVYDSDSRAKLLYDSHPAVVADIEKALGVDLRGADGRLDRRALASEIFGDSHKLSLVEGIVHPYVFADFLDWRNSYFGLVPFVVLESAIFLQKPLFRPLADKILLVDAPEEVRLSRIVARDALKEEDVLKRMRSQEVDKSLADVVIMNDDDVASLLDKVDAALDRIWTD